MNGEETILGQLQSEAEGVVELTPCPALRAVIFDLDGVVTRTARVHFAAWKETFDRFLTRWATRYGGSQRPFDHRDYLAHVDGKRRQDGVRGFLQSRNIVLPDGSAADPPGTDSVESLAREKNAAFLDRLDSEGPEVFPSTVAHVRALKRAGYGVAVVSSSRNCDAVLRAAGLPDLFPVRVDGVDAAELALPGKPDPAMFLEAARRLGVSPAGAVVVEDALAGVEAGRRGGFKLTVGVDRGGQREAMRQRGAQIVVADLARIRLRLTPREDET